MTGPSSNPTAFIFGYMARVTFGVISMRCEFRMVQCTAYSVGFRYRDPKTPVEHSLNPTIQM